MNPKENDNEIIELTEEELDEIFADDDFDNGEEDVEILSFYFSYPDPYAKGKPRSDDALREIVKAVYVDAPDKSSGKPAPRNLNFTVLPAESLCCFSFHLIYKNNL